MVLGLSPGGTERLVIEIARRLESEVQTVVCCLDDPGDWAGELHEVGIPVVALFRRPGFRPGLGRRIADLVDEHQLQILHCHHYSPFVYGAIAALHRSAVKVVFTEHGRLFSGPPSRKRRLANYFMRRLPAAAYTVSGDLKRHLVSEGFSPEQVQVIYNGIEIGSPPTAETRLAARRQLCLPEDAFVIGTIARLDTVKQLQTLIDEFATLRSKVAEAQLVIVGDGPERERLETRVCEHALTPAVRFTGHRADARALLPAFDVYANSSLSEGVSLTILEAMAASLPVVATNVGGTPEVVVEGVTGLLVPERPAGALAAALDSLGRMPDRRQSLGASGRRRVADCFTIDRMVHQYLQVYRSLASN